MVSGDVVERAVKAHGHGLPKVQGDNSMAKRKARRKKATRKKATRRKARRRK
jgi:hypothetical protein